MMYNKYLGGRGPVVTNMTEASGEGARLGISLACGSCVGDEIYNDQYQDQEKESKKYSSTDQESDPRLILRSSSESHNDRSSFGLYSEASCHHFCFV